MREDNYQKWMRLVACRPHSFTIFLRRLFAPSEDRCNCRTDGNMYAWGNMNSCIKCSDSFCTLDSHLFLGSMPTAVLGWMSMLLEGNKNVYW